jgi:hypothetical protein
MGIIYPELGMFKRINKYNIFQSLIRNSARDAPEEVAFGYTLQANSSVSPMGYWIN